MERQQIIAKLRVWITRYEQAQITAPPRIPRQRLNDLDDLSHELAARLLLFTRIYQRLADGIDNLLPYEEELTNEERGVLLRAYEIVGGMLLSLDVVVSEHPRPARELLLRHIPNELVKKLKARVQDGAASFVTTSPTSTQTDECN